MPPISCVPKDHFWKKNFYCFSVQTSTIKTYIQQTNHNQQQKQKKKSFHHYNSISYCLFEYNLRFSLTLSHRENFSFKAPLKYKRNKKKRTTFKRSSSHETKQKNIYKKYTCRKSAAKVNKKKNIKKLQTLFIHEKASIHSH